MFGRHSFKRGIFLDSYKNRSGGAIEPLPPPARVVLPMVQHDGVPAIPLVKHGDRVLRGQMIAEVPCAQSTATHASISGTVTAVAPYYYPGGKKIMAVEIENDGRDESAEPHKLDKPWREAAQGEIVQAVIAGGIAGMSGSGIPAHIKLAAYTDKPVDILIVNALGDEPPVTAAEQFFCDAAEQALEGALIVKKTVSAKRLVIAVDKKNKAALAAIGSLRQDKRFADIELCQLSVKHPLGEEITLVHCVTGRTVPAGRLARDAGCVVFSTATLAAISDVVVRGIPLYERVISVAGAGISRPKNLRVRIGTLVEDILLACQADLSAVKKIILGGPMTGIALAQLATPVIKTTTGIITLPATTPPEQEFDCVRCGACFQVCPRRLVPAVLAECVRGNDLDKAKAWGIRQCCQCGCCAYVCPSKINLAHYIALGNYKLTLTHNPEPAS